MKKTKFLIISTFFISTLFCCKISKIIDSSAYVDNITIYYTSFQYYLKSGIKYYDIEKKSEYKITLKNHVLFKRKADIDEEINKMIFVKKIALDKLLVRAKIIINYKKGETVLYVLGMKSIFYNGSLYKTIDDKIPFCNIDVLRQQKLNVRLSN